MRILKIKGKSNESVLNVKFVHLFVFLGRKLQNTPNLKNWADSLFFTFFTNIAEKALRKPWHRPVYHETGRIPPGYECMRIVREVLLQHLFYIFKIKTTDDGISLVEL